MTQLFKIHPQTPQRRLVSQAVALIRAGALVVYPTDSCYAFGCHMGNKQAMERIGRIRQLGSVVGLLRRARRDGLSARRLQRWRW